MFPVSVLLLPLSPGVSAGPMNLLIVRQRTWQYFLISGPALDEVCEAQELAKAGEVILSAAAWNQCEQRSLRTRRCAGKRARKVGGWDGV